MLAETVVARGAVTTAPPARPRWIESSPIWERIESPSRRVARLTASWPASSRSGGSEAPGCRLPERMRPRSPWTTASTAVGVWGTVPPLARTRTSGTRFWSDQFVAAFSEGRVQLSIGDTRYLGVARFNHRLVSLGIARILTLPIAPLTVTLVRLLTVLPADALASVILTVTLIAILGDALIAELSLCAVAIAGKLALPFTAGKAAIGASVLNRGTLVANSPLVTLVTRESVFVVLVPVGAALLRLLMVVTCHFEGSPWLAHRVAHRISDGLDASFLMGRKGCAIEGCPGRSNWFRHSGLFLPL